MRSSVRWSATRAAIDARGSSRGCGHVLDRLAHVEADLLAPDRDRVPAEVDDGHLGGVAGPRRRLLEDERHAAALEDRGEGRGRSARSSTRRSISVGARSDIDQQVVRHYVSFSLVRPALADAGDGVGEQSHRLVAVLGGDDERWHEPDDPGSRARSRRARR